MVAKSERIELRFDPDTLERLDTWRLGQRQQPNRSEAIRELVEDRLAATTSTSLLPSSSEKLMIYLLTEILKRQKPLDKHDREQVEFIQDAMFGGHYWALEWQMTGVFHDHVDGRQDVSTVVNILDTWNFIERAFEHFTDQEKATLQKETGSYARNPKFLGFDGNNEIEHMGIVMFLVGKLGRFQRFKGRDFNSHMPTLELYSRMADIFETIRPKLHDRELNVLEVSRLLQRS